ncbi:MAG: dockerin type I repeat-containing protein [Phycisphaerales bacterium]
MPRLIEETRHPRRRLALTQRRLIAVLSVLPAFVATAPTLAATEMFTISLDQVVSNGVPAAGAGNLEVPGAVDIYSFTADPGAQVFFNEINTNNCDVTWTLKDASQATIFSQQLGQCGPDAGTFILGGGAYTLTVQIPGGVGTAIYSFVLVTPDSAQEFDIALDQLVSNGNPAPGAGNLEFPGAVDIYTLTAAPSTEVFFDEVQTSNCNISWTVTDPSNAVLFSQQLGQCGPDAGTFVLAGGTYTIRVEDLSGNGTGTYSFVLITSASTQHFDIGLDQVVSNGVPATGAGNIESPGAVDTYTFTAPPDTPVFFDEISTTNCNISWTVRDASDAIVFSQQLGQCGPDAGTFVLAGGTYTIRVEDSSGNGTGTYAFVLVTPESAQHFNINLDQVVNNGAPAAGAGNIETPGAVDIYTFTAPPATQVFFDEVSTTNCSISWTVTDPSNAVLFSQQLGQCGPDAGTFVLAGGTYTIRVEDLSGNGTGTYSFVLVTPESAQNFDILYGQPVSNGFPAPGAGNLETPGAVDIYALATNAGDEVNFNEISTTNCTFIWTVKDPSGTTLFSQPFGQCGPDPGVFVLGGGTYTIRVEDPSGNGTGTYSFAICSVHSIDVNCDGHVNGADVGILLAAWGTAGPAGDLNNDGVVNGADLGLLLAGWTG